MTALPRRRFFALMALMSSFVVFADPTSLTLLALRPLSIVDADRRAFAQFTVKHDAVVLAIPSFPALNMSNQREQKRGGGYEVTRVMIRVTAYPDPRFPINKFRVADLQGPRRSQCDHLRGEGEVGDHLREQLIMMQKRSILDARNFGADGAHKGRIP